MSMLEWIITIVGGFAAKIVETFSDEKVKNWISEGKSKNAQKSVLNLFKQISGLEKASKKFMETLGEFIEKENERRDKFSATQMNSDFQWYARWGERLARQAKSISDCMLSTSKTIDKLSPQAEIYFPDVVEFLDCFRIYAFDDEFIPSEINRKKSEFSELSKVYPHLEDAVKNLSLTRKIIGDFIKHEFSFRDFF